MKVRRKPAFMLASLMLLFTASCSAFAIDIIAHRGASGYLPEHTKEALVMSFMQGADYIEQDLVLSKDKQLIVLHDIHLETVSNVEEVFPLRKREDGRYYVIDFTLAELRTLRIHEREDTKQRPVFPNRYKGEAHFTIATFAEHVELIRALNRALSKSVGLYPELKAPAWHLKQNADITAIFMSEASRLKLNTADANIVVQSFDPITLKRIRNDYKSDMKLVQLIADNSWNESTADYDYLLSSEGLEEVASYAYGIGPWLPQVMNIETGESTGLIERAHALGLLVHPYTFRSDVIGEGEASKAVFQSLKEAKIDGLFTDQIYDYMLQ